MEEESSLQNLEQTTSEITIQNSPRDLGWLFSSGVSLSCFGEFMLIGYSLFSYNDMSSVGFIVALAFLTIGNMIMLTENKLASLTIHLSKTRN